MAKIKLVDTSHWETVDWAVVRPHIYGAINKCTQGTTIVDSKYYSSKNGCIQTACPWASYHFFAPLSDPIAQANFYVSKVQGGSKIFVCDVETTVLNEAIERFQPTTSLGRYIKAAKMKAPWRALKELPEELTKVVEEVISQYNLSTPLHELVNDFCDRVYEQTGYMPWIYSSPYFISSILKPPAFFGLKYDLWIAHYYVEEPIIPAPWSSYILHQYTDRGVLPGVIGNIDLDNFNGTPQEVVSLFGNGSIYQYPEYVIVNSPAGLNLRATNLKGGYIIVAIQNGKELHVIDTKQDEDGRIRYKIEGWVASWLTRPK
ncbi:MAG: hypothetical protein A2W22_03020 [Candidatus Levybacteria bacterium RBG_16_35_11]|nr:MAG: hypothetical protein A2W22_03020 [Candidatus Levybacteria bacterium RBG_16_35_11]